MIKLLMIDLDGTLIESEKAGVSAIKEFASRHSLKLNDKKAEEVFYRSHTQVVREILAANGVREEGKLIEEAKQLYRKHLFNVHLAPYAMEFLDAIHSKVIMILATISSKRSTEISLERHQLKRYFDKVVCRNTYSEEGFSEKCEMFRKILDDAKIMPRECLVVEDTSYGIGQAKSCGLEVIGVRHTFKDIQADYIVDDLLGAKEIILQKIKEG